MDIIKHFQETLEENIKTYNFGQSPRELYEPITYTLSMGGKRLRPALVLLGCYLYDEDIRKAIKPAIGIEVFHNFTLLHDDIMDNAPLRRGMPTVHEKWNPNIAILSGDTMFVKSYELMMECPDNVLRDCLKLFCETAVKVCEGQQQDMNFETEENVTVPKYLKMIENKTAVLLAASLKIGALIGNASKEDADNLYEFGRNIGIAFQLQDDILDVYGNKETFGKQVGGDIIANKKTFLLLKALSIAHKYMKEELDNWIFAKDFNKEEKVTAVTDIYNFLNIKSLSETEMNKYYDKAFTHLDKINVPADYKKLLVGFTEQLRVRTI